jgi:putative membrane protein insertion efficiency factor
VTQNANRSTLQAFVLGLIWAYKRIVSPWLPPACGFVPTCSDYAREAIEKYGVVKGGGKALYRLSRCHPLHSGGVDLVD